MPTHARHAVRRRALARAATCGLVASAAILPAAVTGVAAASAPASAVRGASAGVDPSPGATDGTTGDASGDSGASADSGASGDGASSDGASLDEGTSFAGGDGGDDGSSLGAGAVAAVIAGITLVSVGAVVVVRRSRRPGAPAAPTVAAGPLTPPGAPVFLSYSRRDGEVAGRVVDALERAGHGVWRDRDDIPEGHAWRQAVIEAIEAARLVVVLVSPDSTASPNVEREVTLADESRTPIIPVLVAPTVLPAGFRFALAGVQYLDLAAVGLDEGIRRLVRAVEAELGVGAPLLPPPAVPDVRT